MSSITDYIANLPKPDCAVSVNGNYLEDLVRGYRTSSVSGRNAMSMDITEATIGNAPGSRYQRKRDESRDLTVSFALVGEDEIAVNMLSRLLQRALNTAESKFVFNDEPTMYWVGTVSQFTEEWQNGAGSDYKAMTGEFTIHCSDPYRHSIGDTIVEIDSKSNINAVVLVNNGSAPTPLQIEAYMARAGSRYLAYSLDKSSTEQLTYILGTATAASATKETPTQVLYADFGSKDGSEKITGWTKNGGVLPPITTEAKQVGTMGYNIAGTYAKSYDDDNDYKYWHGPSISAPLKLVNGKYPTNWTAEFAFNFDDGRNDPKSWGMQTYTLANGSTNVVSVMLIDTMDDQQTQVRVYVNNTMYILGYLKKNGLHNGLLNHIAMGIVRMWKTGSDLSVSLAYTNLTGTPTINKVTKREDQKDQDGEKTVTASTSVNNTDGADGPTITVTLKVKQKSVDVNKNTSVIEWSAYADQSNNPCYGDLTRVNAPVAVDIWINNTDVCREPIKLQNTDKSSGYFRHNIWTSGTRTMTINHDSDGSKTIDIRVNVIGYTYTATTGEGTGTLKLSTLEPVETQAWAIHDGNQTTLYGKYTIGNPTQTIDNVTWYTAAYGPKYSVGDDGAITGHKRFNNSNLLWTGIYKQADTAANVEEVYFKRGDTITVDADTNTAKQNGVSNLSMIDITSDPLLLYPGEHTLKIAVDTANYASPPTLRISYKERWK